MSKKQPILFSWANAQKFAGLLTLLMYSLLLPAQLIAQGDQIVRGKVVDERNQPVANVSITAKQTKTGTLTDANGAFELRVNTSDNLTFSIVGYKSQTIAIDGQTNLHVVLKEDESQLLNDVVVIGYGTVRRKDLTGAVSTVKGSSIVSQGSNDFTKSLEGKVPGVNIAQTGGDPGSPTMIVIRGISSFNNQVPLYLVDGVQVSSISSLNQSDIESIDILKDASAAAIYGSRAANGVILVTTRLGTGQPKVEFDQSFSLQKVTHKLGVLNAEQWATVDNTSMQNAGFEPLPFATDPSSLGVGTNWQNAIFQTGNTQQYSLNISGGSSNNKTKYSVSGGYVDQQGTVITTGYKRYNMRVKTETNIGRFKFGETVYLSHEKWNEQPGSATAQGNSWGGQGGTIVGSALKMIPIFKIYDSSNQGGFGGTQGNVVNIANPVAMANLETLTQELTSILSNVYGEVTILPGLTYKMNVGYTNNFTTGTDYLKRYVVPPFTQTTNNISVVKTQAQTTLLENTLNFDRHYGKHYIQALAGYTYQNTTLNYLGASRTGLPDGLSQIDAGSGVSADAGNETVSRLISILGRAIYAYDNRYLLTATFRRDGSSRFAPDHRYGNFPSIALGWNISNEKFFQPLAKTITTLKIRTSYGVLGNQEIGDYQFQGVVSPNIDYVTGTSPTLWTGGIQTSLVDNNIKWENTATYDAGLDAAFIDNKLSFSFDYFKKTTSDLLVSVPLPGSTGSINNPVTNAGKIENWGFEFGANYQGNAGPLTYNIYATASIIRNKVLSLGSATNEIWSGQPTLHGSNTTLTKVGKPVAEFFLIKDLGIFQDQDEINSYTHNGNLIQPNASPGDIKFQDTNGDGIIDQNDAVDLGSPFPKLEYGFGFNAAYHNFDINVYLQGTYGNKIYNGLRQELESVNSQWNYSTAVLNSWTANNTNTSIPRLISTDPNLNGQTSSRFLESGAYLRMKTLQIGYNLKGIEGLKKIGISSLRIFLSADNLFTITKYKGFNPDLARAPYVTGTTTLISNSILNTGVDFSQYSYPLSRTFSTGVQLNF